MASRKSTGRKRTASRPKRASARRTTVAPRGDKRYVRRDRSGRFKESDDSGRSLSRDGRRRARARSRPGQGDRGDR